MKKERIFAKLKDIGVIRKLVQIGNGIVSNAYVKGFLTATIYKGPLKHFCVPGLNCYSCPGALFACPIGSMQSFFAARNRKVPAYVLGFLAAVGLLVGRFICGWLCLFGLIEELLYLVPVPKITLPKKADRVLRFLKYAVFLILVVALPLAYRNELGVGEPFFCKYLCPAGTLEGGAFLVTFNEGLRATVGFLFQWKVLVMVLILASCMFIHRPFCKYLCPLGAFYALFNKISVLRLKFDADKCIQCGKCKEACNMQVDPTKCPDSAECIRCGDCIRSCPARALRFDKK